MKIVKQITILLFLLTFLDSNAQNVEKANEYFNNEQYELAAKEFKLALETTEAENGRDKGFAEICLFLATSLDRSNDIEAAISYYILCNQTYQSIHNGLTENYYGTSLNNLALLYESMGQYEKALPLYLDALENTKKSLGKNHSEYGIRLDNLARLYEFMGQYEKAQPLYLGALKNIEKSLGIYHPYYCASLSSLASLYQTMGQYEEALPLYLEALENTEKSLGKDHSYYGINISNLASLYQTMGQYEKALPLYHEALEHTEKSLGKDHSDYGVGLTYLANLYKSMKQYEKAGPLYLEALENTEKSLGKDHSNYGTSLNNLALLYFSMEQYEKALPLFLEALQNTEKSFGKDHPNYGISLSGLAHLYQDMGQYEKALPLFLEALQNTEKSFGKDHPNYDISLSGLAHLYQDMGQYKKALPLFLEALQNTEKLLGKDHSNYGISLTNLAGLYESMGQYEKALPLYLDALKNTKKSHGKDHSSYGFSLNNLASLYVDMGQYEKALPLFLEALENTKKSLGKDHSSYGFSLGNLALLYETMEQYKKALPLYLQSLKNTEKSLGKDHSSYGTLLNHLAGLYQSMGQYEKALPLYLDALENVEKSLGKDHSDYGPRLNNLALLYALMGQYKKALPLYLEALENTEKSFGKDHFEYCRGLNNLALLYFSIREYEKALSLYLEALENAEKSLGKDHSNYGAILNNLAQLYLSMGKYEEALPLYLEALKNTEKSLGEDHSRYGTRLNSLALLYNTMGQYKKALPLYLKGIDVINYNIRQNFDFMSENDKDSYVKTVAFNFKIFNSFAVQCINENLKLSSYVFDNALINKGLLLKSSVSMRAAVLGSGDTTLISKFEEWTDLNRQIARLYSTEKSKRYQDPKVLEEMATTIERELVSASQEFSDYKSIQKPWLDVQKGLGEYEAAIEFISFDYHNKEWTDSTLYCALVVRPNSKLPEMIPLFEEKEYENSINNSNNSSDAGLIARLYGKKRRAYSLTSGNTYSSYADSLYSLIWSKIDPCLGGVETVYYSPSGLLHNISFAAIPYNDSLLLSDKYDLVYVASTGNIINKKAQKDISEFNVAIYGGLNYDTDTIAMLAVANNYNIDNLLASRSVAVSDSTRGGTWNYLQGTLDEAENIESMFENNNISTNLYTANYGVEESFKSLSGRNSPEIIHLATHGFFFPDPEKEKSDDIMMSLQDKKVFKDSDNPLIRSGLIMSGANLAWNGEAIPEGIDDGILTAYEVSGLDLYNTELVVLSACETGLGDIVGSEGVYGLQRSFKMAGVDYLVMSLWQVPDKETSEFMQLFYQNMLAKQSVGVAFRNAQKVMKQKYDPYYWAAFVLIE